MTTQIWIVLITFALFIGLVLSGKVKIHVAALLIPALLEITHVLSFNEAWGGLTNSSVVMMAAMFVLTAGLNRTSLVSKLSHALIKPGASDLKIMIGLTVPMIPLGCFINGTATYTIMIPLVTQVCAEQKRPLSKFVFPMTMMIGIWVGAFPIGGNAASYMTSNTIVENLGGIGTWTYWTNFIVKIPYLLLGTLIILLIGVKIAPDNGNIPALAGVQEHEAPAGGRGRRGEEPLTPQKERLIMIIFVCTVVGIISCAVAGIFGVKGLQVWYPAVIGAILMVCTGCVSDRAAVSAMGSPVIFITVGTLPLATALSKTGADALIADAFNAVTGGMSPIMIMAAMYLLCMILTQFLTNSAVSSSFRMLAALIAVQNGWDARALMLAVAQGSGNGFIYPAANPVFTMAHEDGGYTLAQHAKQGLIYSLIWFAIFVVYVPIVFPLS